MGEFWGSEQKQTLTIKSYASCDLSRASSKHFSLLANFKRVFLTFNVEGSGRGCVQPGHTTPYRIMPYHTTPHHTTYHTVSPSILYPDSFDLAGILRNRSVRLVNAAVVVVAIVSVGIQQHHFKMCTFFWPKCHLIAG